MTPGALEEDSKAADAIHTSSLLRYATSDIQSTGSLVNVRRKNVHAMLSLPVKSLKLWMST
jgi:hypothetical protein